MAKSGHVDIFARDNLPPREQWPEFKFDLPELQYPERLNCITEFLDRWVAAARGGRPCLISPKETLTYAQLAQIQMGSFVQVALQRTYQSPKSHRLSRPRRLS